MIVKPLFDTAEDIHRFLYLNQANPEYENLLINDWLDAPKPNKDTWSNLGFSFHTDDGALIGWVQISIGRPLNDLNVSSLAILDKKYSVSIMRFVIKNIKLKMNTIAPKITFSTLVGSHAESVWDKLMYKYNGRVVGIEKRQALDNRGNLRDMVLYEILNDNYKG